MNQQPNNFQRPNDPGKGTGAASLVLGIVGLCTGWLYGVGCVLGIIGVVLAVVSGNKSSAVGLNRNGLAIGGLVCSIIAIVSGAGCLICTVCAGAAARSTASTFSSYAYNF